MQLTPSADRIRNVAIDHFAEHGYAGASLNTIAELAGMRKASLYSHFSSKDALFLSALDHAFELEKIHATEVFTEDQHTLAGLSYLASIGSRYDRHASLRFLLRAAYAPPIALRDEVTSRHRDLLQFVSELFSAKLTAAAAEKRSILTNAYLGAVDSLHVEALFGNDFYLDQRRTALWSTIEHYARSGT